MSEPVIAVDNLVKRYGTTLAVGGIDFAVERGVTAALLGSNGAGKTTTLKSIMGIIGARTGSVSYEANQLIGLTSDRIARLGIAFCPEARGIFASLSVRENLLLPPRVLPDGLEVERVFELFPNLKERLTSQGTKLSGGEQQMLAIGRILRTGARLLLLDEPTEGLAPVIVDALLAGLNRLKREDDLTLLLVEQHARLALEFAEDVLILDRGAVVHAGPSRALLDAPDRLASLIGVGRH